MTERGAKNVGPSSMHRYFSWRRGPESVAVELPNGSVWDKTVFPEWRYPLAVLAEATREFQQERLHFYFTRDARALPEYGNHVVVILWQEERCKVPTYARHVRGVIRCLEATPFLGFRPGPATNKYEMVLTFQYLRDWATHLLSQRRFRNPPTHWPAPVHEITRVLTIPLGYHSQIELPQIPMSERKLDAFFTGEVRGRVAKTTYQYWTSDSKTEARKQLWNALMELRKNPEWRIEMADISGGEGVPRVPQFSSYSQKMMNARICLAPRGTMAETFRFYEGLRAGCLVICNRLPPEPFLEGAPVIQIDNWKELPGLMQKYARDLDALEHYRCASLEFWNTRLSEPVIGRKVAKFLSGEPVIWPDKTTDLEESETG